MKRMKETVGCEEKSRIQSMNRGHVNTIRIFAFFISEMRFLDNILSKTSFSLCVLYFDGHFNLSQPWAMPLILRSFRL